MSEPQTEDVKLRSGCFVFSIVMALGGLWQIEHSLTRIADDLDKIVVALERPR